jgi:dTDP-4-amino-4,6-dideoxygalactose transaminase
MKDVTPPLVIPFSRPEVGSTELEYLAESLRCRKISGDGPFTQRCHALLNGIYGGSTTFLVHSGTAALEMAALLIDLKPGDEVIMPSFTFTSTANAVVFRGAVPVFVDIRLDTLNIDESKIEGAISARTKAILPIHYAGVAAEMSSINAVAARHGLYVIEDAAQGFGATYNEQPLGSIGDIGCLSFHETKNITSGEGGAIIINNPEFMERAYYIREKGTNRTQFLRGEVTKYEWIDIGSSYLPSDLIAAVLLAQLERANDINARRLEIWERYYRTLLPLTNAGLVLPTIPSKVQQNAHIFFLRMPNNSVQQHLLRRLRKKGIQATSHYVPLHSSPAGNRFGRTAGDMSNTDLVASTIVRLPLYSGLTDDQVEFATRSILEAVEEIVEGCGQNR